ncbi:MAG: hypothetical protein ACRCW2_15990 [Cellulosilyticaceae bacterium]
MMFKKMKKIMSLGLAATVLLVGCGGSTTKNESAETSGDATNGTSTKTEQSSDLVVIRFGSHAGNSMNPDYKDPVTGEYSMSEEEREIRLAAMQKVKDELNVQIEWVQYPGDTTETLLQSVMAGDPIADVVNLYTNSQATILGQNVLQPLDEYADLLGENPPDKIYDKYYFMSVSGGGVHPLSPLFFNISYIEQVDALKENGKTVYPTDLYKEGKWTWSVFEEYLAKIDAHFANSQAPERPEKRIDAFITDYSETLYNAIHAAGGAVYGNDGLGVESQEVIDSVAFVQRLIDKKLLKSEVVEGTSDVPWNFQEEPFKKGESVFTNLEDWRLGGSVAAAAERGQSIGFIPFPRPDSMAFDDPAYQQLRTGGESWGILRGVDPEKIPLAIEAYFLYNQEKGRLEKELAGDVEAKGKIFIPIDLFHPEIGADMEEIYYESTARTVVNEFANMTGVYWRFVDVAGDSLYGVDGSPRYEVAIKAKKAIMEDRIAEIQAILNTTEAKDNIKPKFESVEGTTPYAFPKGTDPVSIKWNEKFTATDNIDGGLDMSKAAFDISATDFNTVGVYSKGVVGAIKDSAENEGKVNLDIIIYDADNKEVPTVTLKEESRKIAIDEDSAKINWAGDFVEVAADKDGIDLKSNITADLSELDTTAAGTYTVALTVTDFAGNVTTVEAAVVVE